MPKISGIFVIVLTNSRGITGIMALSPRSTVGRNSTNGQTGDSSCKWVDITYLLQRSFNSLILQH